MKEFHKESLAVELGRKTKEEALEELRKGLVFAMRYGTAFVIDVGRIVPDFKVQWKDEEVFPIEQICDFDEWRKRKNYMKIVKPDENHDVAGNKHSYVMQPEFNLVFLATYTTDEAMVRFVRNIP